MRARTTRRHLLMPEGGLSSGVSVLVIGFRSNKAYVQLSLDHSFSVLAQKAKETTMVITENLVVAELQCM